MTDSGSTTDDFRQESEQARPAESQRDPDYLRERLQAWLVGKHADAVVETVELPSANGMSSETVLADATWDNEQHRLVVRVAPLASADPVFPSYDMGGQFTVMQHVAATTDVPVPPCYWSEPDTEPLGAPFIVMGRIDGVIPPDVMPYTFGSWVMDATAEQREALQNNAIDVLAKVHAAPTDGLAGAAGPQPAETALAAHVRRLREFYDWASEGNRRAPLLDAALEWVDENMPKTDVSVLNWGDARIGNVIFRDFEPVAALDWEMATLGPRELDLGWTIFLHRFFQDLAELAGLPGLPDFMRRADCEAKYAELTGHNPQDMDFYTAYAAIVHGVIMYRIQMRAIEFGITPAPDDPNDMILHRTTIEKMLAGTYWEGIK